MTGAAVTIRRKVLGDAFEAHLAAGLATAPGWIGATVYPGEVPPTLPVIEVDGQPDPSGRIAPYLVLFDGVGTPGYEVDLADTSVDLLWSCQMILGAGWKADCSNLVDRVYELAYRWSPAIPGLVCGRMKPPPGYDPGPLRRNDAVSPSRWWTPLQWRLAVTA